MTKIIVTTGLDGSGKSTFVSELETKFGSHLAILRLPTIDSDKFKDAPTLFHCCEMINELGERGDKEATPGMKIIALFSAMALFNDMVHHLQKNTIKVLFCERHPLVDTLIYAKAYLKVMHPSHLILEKAEQIDKRYHLLLIEVAARLKIDFSQSKALKSHSLLAFLHHWFSKEENGVPEKLCELFEIQKPDYIYFLDAPAHILIQRIENRVTKEYHENVVALEKMRLSYLSLLPKFGSPLEITDATDKTAPDALIQRLSEIYFSTH